MFFVSCPKIVTILLKSVFLNFTQFVGYVGRPKRLSYATLDPAFCPSIRWLICWSNGQSVSFFLYLFSRVLRDSTTRFVGPSVHPSVSPSVRRSVTLYFFWVFAVFGLTAHAQMIE